MADIEKLFVACGGSMEAARIFRIRAAIYGVFGVSFKGEQGDTKMVIAEVGDGEHFLGTAIVGNGDDPEVEAIIDSIDE